MKIYQLHEYSGVYEDYHDYIIGSYLRKERAMAEKIKAEVEEKELIKRGKRCDNCPFLELDNAFANLDDLIAEYPDYCDKAKLAESDNGINCENYHFHWDEARFEIKEVEVEE